MRTVQSLKRYWQLLDRYLRPYWRQMLLLAFVLAGTIAVQILTPLVATRFINKATSGAAIRDLTYLAILTMSLALIGQGMAVLETYLAEYVSWEATNALRADLLAHLLRLDASFHTSHTLGELIERVDGDVGTLARFFSRFVVSVLGNGILILGVLVLLFGVDWRIGLGLSGFVVLALLATLRIRAVATPHIAADRQANADFYGFLGEYLAGLEDIRSSGAGAFVLHKFTGAMRSWLVVTRRAQMLGYGMIATSEGLFGLGTAVALALGAVLFREGSLSIGAVYLIFRYTDMLRQPTDQLRNEVLDLQQADASIGRVQALLQTTPNLTDGPSAALPSGHLAVEFDHVSFAYDHGTPVLHDINITLAPGRVLGVIGRTGTGKTTLTRLIPRFYDPTAGTVRLGGVDLRSVRIAAVRERIGMVSQDVHLFNASVRDNVTVFDDTVPDQHITAVLESLGLASWLHSLPDGLETVLDAGGGGLSAGQAQVLACARVLLRDADVVILDEASSRLDPATEQMLHRALGRLLEGRTGIIVAHRLSTFAFADDIVVLEEGQVLEYGTRLELAADPSSRFAHLLRLTEEGALS